MSKGQDGYDEWEELPDECLEQEMGIPEVEWAEDIERT